MTIALHVFFAAFVNVGGVFITKCMTHNFS